MPIPCHRKQRGMQTMRNPVTLRNVTLASMLSLVASSALAATFVYVSNAEDGDISTYTMRADGARQPGPRVKAGSTVMPMTVSPDRRFLFAAVRSKPFSVHTFAID